MKNVKTSIFVFGIYMLIAGLGFILMPNLVLGSIALPATNEIWIRVVGLFVFVLGLLYVQSTRENNSGFYAMTIWGRAVFAIGLIGVVLFTGYPLQVLLLPIVDLAAVGWTWYASRQQVQVATT